MLLLEFCALFDPALCSSKRPVLQFANQFWVERYLLGSYGVQIADTFHVSLGGGHVQRRVVVVVQAPHVGTESHQEGQAVVVAIGSCQVERRVAPNVTLVWVSAGRQRQMVSTTQTCKGPDSNCCDSRAKLSIKLAANQLAYSSCLSLLPEANDLHHHPKQLSASTDLQPCQFFTCSRTNPHS